MCFLPLGANGAKGSVGFTGLKGPKGSTGDTGATGWRVCKLFYFQGVDIHCT